MSFIKGLKLNQHQKTDHSRTYQEVSYVRLPRWIWVLNQLMLEAQKEQSNLNDSKLKQAVIMLKR